MHFLGRAEIFIDTFQDVRLIHYDKHRQHLFPYFFSVCGLSCDTSDFYPFPGTINRSFTTSEINLFLYLNEKGLKEDNLQRKIYAEKIQKNKTPPIQAQYYPEHSAKKLYERYQEFLKKVNAALPNGEKLPETLDAFFLKHPEKKGLSWNSTTQESDWAKATKLLGKTMAEIGALHTGRTTY